MEAGFSQIQSHIFNVSHVVDIIFGFTLICFCSELLYIQYGIYYPQAFSSTLVRYHSPWLSGYKFYRTCVLKSAVSVCNEKDHTVVYNFDVVMQCLCITRDEHCTNGITINL